ncbi:MAG: excinuclease ABC subunit A [Deltaproteobacteria bacterium]|nr:excinuclease ABC subunit A [Deltaproteobacteria bacterium]
MRGEIVVRGARVHNLKNIDLEIPREQLVVITGVSGSGKSSLAFDTLYAEGQRRYIESLSADTRQLLQQMDPPDVDSIDGLSPAIAVQQRSANFGPRSTVGTVSEIHDFLRLLFARVGQPACIRCGADISVQTTEQIVDQLTALPVTTRVIVLAPVGSAKKIDSNELLREFARQGFTRVRIDGEVHELYEQINLKKNRSYRIDLVIDRLSIREGIEKRLAESVEVASRVGQQVITVEVQLESAVPPIKELRFSQKFACAECGSCFAEVTPSLFSFNSPHGACAACGGLGSRQKATRKSDRDTGATALVKCNHCQGARLRKESLGVTIEGKNIAQVTALPIAEAIRFFETLRLGEKEQVVGAKILTEVLARLRFLAQLGLEYLTLDRPSATLSGGEAQRVGLATQIGSSLSGVLYILDEPSIGLHQKDNAQLLELLKRLRDGGNSVVVVEHDPETILSADHVIDMGPGAGLNGGQVVAQGTAGKLMAHEHSLTGQYLSGRRTIPIPSRRRTDLGESLIIKGAQQNNLRDITVEIPVGVMTCVTGVSGSGKSTLVMDVLYDGVSRRLRSARTQSGTFDDLTGWENFDRVIGVDQSPIGRTPRSNPATYTGIYEFIRELFAKLPEARVRGYKPNRFSFNTSGGRCEACSGDGVRRIEMYFLADVFATCDVCKGRRYNRETLEIKYKGHSIADVLQLTVVQALDLFASIPAVSERLHTLISVGLGYLQLGQPAQTLSGGESQRVKLAKELARRSAGRSLYVLDEPTSGLHFSDIDQLLGLLHRLTDAGNTLVIIEHNLEVIKNADYVIDLGPEAGVDGGTVIALGTPEEVAAVADSHTGRYLGKVLTVRE